MPQFKYAGKSTQGGPQKGVIEAASAQAAAQALLSQNIVPLTIVESKKRSAENEGDGFDITRLFQQKVGLDEMIIFSRQMYSLLKAGIPIIRAIKGLSENASHKRFQEILKDIADQLEQGRSLSSSMAKYEKVFTRLTISVVVVGENTGKLDDVFLQLALYFEREQETRKRIKSALRYPTFVLIALAIAMFILNLFVVPVFTQMFERFDTELPIMTRVLIGTSNFFVNYWWLLIIVIVGGIFAVKQYVNSTNGRLKWDKFKLKLPVVGSIIERSLLSRYSRSFSMILRAGVPLTAGLSLTADAVDNAHMQKRIKEMRQGIEKGESLLRVSKNSELFSTLVLQMIAVGEETGRLEPLLEESADYYEREVDFDLKSLTAKIEPILIGFVAVMVLILALGIFTPMWNMMSAVKGG
ncbi:type II secretion system F family protein [Alteromonas macleodii]|jgi:MSHA biogenesis protein MshG|uniref:Type II secretion system (T2SS), F family protein n=2 Tax=Alteromonas macleodii TaxID=28108 RepID=A0A1E7DJ71_ALTMA|nr:MULTISPECIES: type II secretion system F family protein [Alteromonas]MEC8450133.1 type II secretion system F family protein [Pseudomonadota bacterium]AFT72916.1 putative mannose-sensitive agglutinin biogenesis protein MshG [Alteromonas macleodii str. 'English Channel 673']MAW04179.1 type II secretion system F family protein [Alteromonas sp.]MBL3811090.1 type II secretion system F family protein [Alteromonas macleodii]MBL3884627.1 type II secretion system F family protein [Alteromonas macleo|tara:strand:+ start:222 stop:1457 length:1236 start_codon:yes stop_codon:yes gene_type:complete